GAHGDRKQKGKERDEARAHRQLGALVFVEHVHQQKAKNAQQQPGTRMQRDIPPPQAVVIAMDFTQEQGGKNEQNRQNLEFGRDINPESAPQRDRHQGNAADGKQQERMHPMAVIDDEHQLHRHDDMQKNHQITVDTLRPAVQPENLIIWGFTRLIAGHENRYGWVIG